MLFKALAIFMIISTSAIAGRNCGDDLIRDELLKQDHDTKSRYGMVRDNARYQPPTGCTPFMSEAKFIPLTKRQSGGNVNRPRYMDKDCNVYEWDFQHGNFERYTTNGNRLRHVGDISPVHGVDDTSKTDSDRNYVNSGDTGYDGLDLKKLCDKHKENKLRPNQFPSRAVRCI